nr:hypothetical protein [Anaerolineae bacterium]
MATDKASFPWWPILAGLIIGLTGGLVYAWFINPVEWVNIAPDRLGVDDQREYILLVAEAYMQERDLERARSRLVALGVHDIGDLVGVQADSALLRGDPPSEVRALSTLAEALGANPLAAAVFSGTVIPTSEMTTSPAIAQPFETPTPTIEILETPTSPTPTPTPPIIIALELVDRTRLCRENENEGLLQIQVTDRYGNGLPGIEILVEWEEGQDRFYTGLKPAIDPGYADFAMSADQVYRVTLVGLSDPVEGISSEICQAPEGRDVIPSYELVFSPLD